MDHGLEDEPLDPGIGADVVAVVDAVGAPAVFDLPAVGLSVGVDVHAGEDHGVRELRDMVVEHIRLGDILLQTGDQLEVVAVFIPLLAGGLAEFSAVAAEPDRFAVAQLGDDRRLEGVDVEVEVGHAVGADDIVQVFDGVALAEGLVGRRGVDDADVIVENIADVFGGEGCGREVGVDVIGAVLVHVFKVEGLGGRAVAGDEEGIDLREHPFLFRADLGGRRAGLHHGAQDGRGAAQVAVDEGIEVGGGGGLRRFGHRVLRDDTVFPDEVDEHSPLSAVADAGLDDVIQLAVAEGRTGGGDDGLKIIVAALELVPEGKIALRKLKILDVDLLGGQLAQDVGRGEEPAAAARFLIGRFQRFDVHGEFVEHPPRFHGVKSQCVERAHGKRVGHGETDGIALIRRLEGFQFPGSEGLRFVCHGAPPKFAVLPLFLLL